MKYLKHEPFSVPVKTADYEEIFVRCHCACHEPGFSDVPCWNIHTFPPCCRVCPECGAKVKLGSEKRHECDER